MDFDLETHNSIMELIEDLKIKLQTMGQGITNLRQGVDRMITTTDRIIDDCSRISSYKTPEIPIMVETSSSFALESSQIVSVVADEQLQVFECPNVDADSEENAMVKGLAANMDCPTGDNIYHAKIFLESTMNRYNPFYITQQMFDEMPDRVFNDQLMCTWMDGKFLYAYEMFISKIRVSLPAKNIDSRIRYQYDVIKWILTCCNTITLKTAEQEPICYYTGHNNVMRVCRQIPLFVRDSNVMNDADRDYRLGASQLAEGVIVPTLVSLLLIIDTKKMRSYLYFVALEGLVHFASILPFHTDNGHVQCGLAAPWQWWQSLEFSRRVNPCNTYPESGHLSKVVGICLIALGTRKGRKTVHPMPRISLEYLELDTVWNLIKKMSAQVLASTCLFSVFRKPIRQSPLVWDVSRGFLSDETAHWEKVVIALLEHQRDYKVEDMYIMSSAGLMSDKAFDYSFRMQLRYPFLVHSLSVVTDLGIPIKMAIGMEDARVFNGQEDSHSFMSSGNENFTAGSLVCFISRVVQYVLWVKRETIVIWDAKLYHKWLQIAFRAANHGINLSEKGISSTAIQQEARMVIGDLYKAEYEYLLTFVIAMPATMKTILHHEYNSGLWFLRACLSVTVRTTSVWYAGQMLCNYSEFEWSITLSAGAGIFALTAVCRSILTIYVCSHFCDFQVMFLETMVVLGAVLYKFLRFQSRSCPMLFALEQNSEHNAPNDTSKPRVAHYYGALRQQVQLSVASSYSLFTKGYTNVFYPRCLACSQSGSDLSASLCGCLMLGEEQLIQASKSHSLYVGSTCARFLLIQVSTNNVSMHLVMPSSLEHLHLFKVKFSPTGELQLRLLSELDLNLLFRGIRESKASNILSSESGKGTEIMAVCPTGVSALFNVAVQPDVASTLVDSRWSFGSDVMMNNSIWIHQQCTASWDDMVDLVSAIVSYPSHRLARIAVYTPIVQQFLCSIRNSSYLSVPKFLAEWKPNCDYDVEHYRSTESLTEPTLAYVYHSVAFVWLIAWTVGYFLLSYCYGLISNSTDSPEVSSTILVASAYRGSIWPALMDDNVVANVVDNAVSTVQTLLFSRSAGLHPLQSWCGKKNFYRQYPEVQLLKVQTIHTTAHSSPPATLLPSTYSSTDQQTSYSQSPQCQYPSSDAAPTSVMTDLSPHLKIATRQQHQVHSPSNGSMPHLHDAQPANATHLLSVPAAYKIVPLQGQRTTAPATTRLDHKSNSSTP